METLTIGQVAREAHVGLETIRFYERQGLIESPPRSPSGYRAFPPGTVVRLHFIRTAKDLGFTLKEIRELLSLEVDPVGSCPETRAIAESKIDDIDRRIRSLERMRRALRGFVASCETREPTSECPILESLRQETHE